MDQAMIVMKLYFNFYLIPGAIAIVCSPSFADQWIYLFVVLRFQTSIHHTTIALKKLGHHNSLTPITEYQ
jgi:hypothetical protein